MTFAFTKAEKKKAKLRLALSGPAGAGKTYSSLLIASGIGGRIAVIDSENGSAHLYSDVVPFDVLELKPPFTPERYVQAIHAAEAAGYDVLIIDSITHEWNGAGGVLEIVDAAARASRSGNKFNAWDEGSTRHRKFIDAMVQSPMHIIATMRSKAAYVQGTGKDGRTEIKKVGMAPEQRDGIEFEFTLVLDLNNDGNVATASKDRTSLFQGTYFRPEKHTGEILLEWLEIGVDPAEIERRELEEKKAKARNWIMEAKNEGDLDRRLRFSEARGLPQEWLNAIAVEWLEIQADKPAEAVDQDQAKEAAIAGSVAQFPQSQPLYPEEEMSAAAGGENFVAQHA